MNKLTIILCSAIALLTQLIDVGASVERDFFKQPDIDSLQLSPDGSIVLIEGYINGSSTILIYDVVRATKTAIYNVPSSNQHIRNLSWVDNNTIGFNVVTTRNKSAVFIKITKKGEKFESKVLLRKANMLLVSSLPNKESKAIVATYPNGKVLFHLVNVNEPLKFQTKGKHRINRGIPESSEIIFSKNGKISSYQVINDGIGKVFYRLPKRRKFNLIYEYNADEFDLNIELFDREKGQIYVLTNKDSDVKHIRAINVNSGELSDVIHIENKKDIGDILVHPYKDHIIGYSMLKGGVNKHVYLNRTPINSSNQQKYDGYIINYNKNGDSYLAMNITVDKPAEFFLFTNERVVPLGVQNKALADYTFGTSTSFKTTSTDETEIESFITLPEVVDKHLKVPLIVMPHGGPIGVQDTMHFNHWVQYFVHYGFAVLRTNYRGSAGYGK